MRAQIRREMKIELHRHLELCFSADTLLEGARQEGLPEELEQWLITEPMVDLAAVLKKFVSVQRLFKTTSWLSRWAEEALWLAEAEGIVLVEFRYAPTFIQGGGQGLSFDEIHQAIESGLRQAQRDGCRTEFGLIVTIQRIHSEAVNRPVVNWLLQELRRPGSQLVGVDLADDEMVSPPRLFGDLFAPLRKAGVPITIHAGEARFPGAAQNVIDAIQLLGAQRIGHGLQIAGHSEAIEAVSRAGVTLELCPTSNWLTQAIDRVSDHPLRDLDRAGVRVTLNSDDPGIFGIDLCHEWEVAQLALGCSIEDLRRFQETALEASFCSATSKAKARARFAQP